MVIKSRRIRWAGHVALMGDEKCIESFGQITERKKPLDRSRSGCEDNTRMNSQEGHCTVELLAMCQRIPI
jgi:hypothetical protein